MLPVRILRQTSIASRETVLRHTVDLLGIPGVVDVELASPFVMGDGVREPCIVQCPCLDFSRAQPRAGKRASRAALPGFLAAGRSSFVQHIRTEKHQQYLQVQGGKLGFLGTLQYCALHVPPWPPPHGKHDDVLALLCVPLL